VVAATSAATGVLMCRFDTVGACHALVRTLAVRVGLAAGGMAVLMFLLVAGLMKMMVEDEERREESDEAASVWGEPW
jgi:hypothetical protein